MATRYQWKAVNLAPATTPPELVWRLEIHELDGVAVPPRTIVIFPPALPAAVDQVHTASPDELEEDKFPNDDLVNDVPVIINIPINGPSEGTSQHKWAKVRVKVASTTDPGIATSPKFAVKRKVTTGTYILQVFTVSVRKITATVDS